MVELAACINLCQYSWLVNIVLVDTSECGLILIYFSHLPLYTQTAHEHLFQMSRMKF